MKIVVDIDPAEVCDLECLHARLQRFGVRGTTVNGPDSGEGPCFTDAVGQVEREALVIGKIVSAIK